MMKKVVLCSLLVTSLMFGVVASEVDVDEQALVEPSEEVSISTSTDETLLPELYTKSGDLFTSYNYQALSGGIISEKGEVLIGLDVFSYIPDEYLDKSICIEFGNNPIQQSEENEEFTGENDNYTEYKLILEPNQYYRAGEFLTEGEYYIYSCSVVMDSYEMYQLNFPEKFTVLPTVCLNMFINYVDAEPEQVIEFIPTEMGKGSFFVSGDLCTEKVVIRLKNSDNYPYSITLNTGNGYMNTIELPIGEYNIVGIDSSENLYFTADHMQFQVYLDSSPLISLEVEVSSEEELSEESILLEEAETEEESSLISYLVLLFIATLFFTWTLVNYVKTSTKPSE